MPPMWTSISDVKADLDDSRSSCALKVPIVRLYRNTSFNNREEIVGLECILHDSEGERIEATVPRNLIDKFREQIEEGIVYGLKNFKVIPNTRKCKVTAHKFRILMCEDTKIGELFVCGIPMKMFCFKSFDEAKLRDNLYAGSLFDVIGVLVHPGEVQNRNSPNGDMKKLIEFTIKDLEGRTLSCTLWENYVNEYLSLLEEYNEATNIIIVQFCKPSIYKGEIRVSNSYNVTKLLLNGDIPEIKEFRQRLATESSMDNNDNSISKGIKCSSSDNIFEAMTKLKTIEDLFDDDESECSWIIGTIDRIDWGHGWSYVSCKKCTKKVSKVEQQFYCKNCNAYDSSATVRYKIKVTVKDDTVRAPFLIWDRECVQVIGKTATELKVDSTTEVEGPDSFPKEIQMALLDQMFLFKVLPKNQQGYSFHVDGYSVSNIPFGGKIIVFGGDFRQILPVIPKGSRQDVVHATINSSYLWASCTVLKLTKNMRLHNMCSSDEVIQSDLFSKWIASIGDGVIGGPNDGETTIDLPEDILLKYFEDPIATIIDYVYPSDEQNIDIASYLRERAILAPTLDAVDAINQYMVSLNTSDGRSYLSSNTTCRSESGESIFQDIHTPEFLNSLKCSGIPNHELFLKVGTPIMFLRNIDHTNGLCNGTRLVITRLDSHVLEAKVLDGHKAGYKVLIPRLSLTPSDSEIAVQVSTTTVLVIASYAMTINKSQGQSLSRVGLFLKKPIFTHGQLYVAVSRVTSRNGLKILLCKDDVVDSTSTINVVYKEVFRNL